MAAASPRTWRGAAQRASRSTSLRAQSAKFAVTGALAALIDVSLTWLLQIGFGLLSADPARAVDYANTWRVDGGGVPARLGPTVDPAEAAGLLQRAGFVEPVAGPGAGKPR